MIEQKLSSWMEWKERCALELCGNDTKHQLCDYAWRQGYDMAQAIGLDICLLTGEAFADEADSLTKAKNLVWAYFEQRSLAGTHASGKHYKEWIYDYAAEIDNPEHMLGAILTGVELQMQMVMRTVFSEQLATIRERQNHGRVDQPGYEEFNEYANEWLDRCAHKAEGLLSPGARHAIQPEEQWDLVQMANMIADEWWRDSSPREKLVLWADFNGIPVSDPAVESLAGVKKSQLYVCLCAIRPALLDRVGRHALEKAEGDFVYLALLDELWKRLDKLAESENWSVPGLYGE